MIAQRCPVCYGSGKITPKSDIGTAVPQERNCHGCGGKGWIEVADAYPYWPLSPNPYLPYIPYYPWYPSTYPTVTFGGASGTGGGI